jgi:serine/threonine protein kinase
MIGTAGRCRAACRCCTLFLRHFARHFRPLSPLLLFMPLCSCGHRFCQPENLLLDGDGYLKITDFGFAKDIGDGRTWTLCGTPDYLAPEIVAGKGHGKGVDWWTLGQEQDNINHSAQPSLRARRPPLLLCPSAPCLTVPVPAPLALPVPSFHSIPFLAAARRAGIFIYEMLASYPPFYDEDPMKTYAKIMQGTINFPSHFSKEAVSLIKKLLQHKPTKRLGVVNGGAAEIKKHPWFKNFDFDALVQRKLKPSIVPKIKGVLDTSCFDDVRQHEGARAADDCWWDRGAAARDWLAIAVALTFSLPLSLSVPVCSQYPDEAAHIEPYVDDGSNWEAEF